MLLLPKEAHDITSASTDDGVQEDPSSNLAEEYWIEVTPLVQYRLNSSLTTSD